MQLIESSGYSIQQAKELLPHLSPSEQLDFACAAFYDNPLGFVETMWPWGERGTPLADETGPDDIQRQFLIDLGNEVKARKFDGKNPVMPIQMAESSGHGTGKTCQGAWLAWWILSTRPFSIGTITAGTAQQLQERTWAACHRWGKLCATGHLFDIQASGIYHKQYSDDWKLMPQTCKEENAQSFAGQHASRSTSWYLFDEASQVPDMIQETSIGGMTDGEPMAFAWGQLVRNTGWFSRVCAGEVPGWNHRRVDSRFSRFTNKALIAQWEKDYGVDSDFFKVRVRGLAPSADELQYIDKQRVDEARKRKMMPLPNDPLIAGFDVSGGGSAWNVIRFRRGLDGNPLPSWRLPGDKDPDRSARIAKCAELLSDTRPGHQLAALFIDTAFGAAIAVALKNMGFKNVYEVNFGGESPDFYCLNMRAYMWKQAKDFLLLGGIPDEEHLPSDKSISKQLGIPGYHINNSGKLVIESKRSIIDRGEKSPDDADAFCLTFARQMAQLPSGNGQPSQPIRRSQWG